MKKQVELSFSNTAAELNVYHALMSQIKHEKNQSPLFLGQVDRTDKFVNRLKRRFA